MLNREKLETLRAEYLDKSDGFYDRKAPRRLHTSPQQIEIAERRAIACEMRKEGKSFRQIALVLECSNNMAREYVKKALEELIELTKEDIEDIREIELMRLDAMWAGIAEGAMQGDLDAIDRGLKIQERRTRYLGLDSANKLEVTGKDGKPLVDPRELLNSRISELTKRSGEDRTPTDDPDGSDSGVA